MKIELTLDVDDEDADEANSSGLTAEADGRLYEAITEAGFGIVRGPYKS